MTEPKKFADPFLKTVREGYRRMATKTQAHLRMAIQKSQGFGGFFAGRDGREDLYFTYFGVVLAVTTDATFRKEECRRRFLEVEPETLDLVHLCSYIRAFSLLQTKEFSSELLKKTQEGLSRSVRPPKAVFLEELLPTDAFPQRDSTSPYSRFLAETLYGDYNVAIVASDLSAYRLPDGLYSNLSGATGYQTNATAAALFLLPEEEAKTTAAAFRGLQQKNGAFKATESAPTPDLLSTGVALFALRQSGLVPAFDPKPFLRECLRDDGLFAATPDDESGDLEYSVYGLLAMGAR